MADDFELEPLQAETAPAVMMPDYVATLRLPGRPACTFHVEFFVQYRDEIPAKMARYGGSLAWQYQRPVTSVLFLLKAGRVPAMIPSLGEYTIGGTKLTHAFRTVRLWELDPEPLLEEGNPGLLPWALLMKLSHDEAFRLGAIVSKSGNEQWISRFLTLGSLRYHREELQRMLGGPRMGLVEAIMEGSSLVQEAKEQAASEGHAQGHAQGHEEGHASGQALGEAKEARRILRLALFKSFPGLETMPELDRISDVGDLEALLIEQVMVTGDRSIVEQAIRATAAQSDPR